MTQYSLSKPRRMAGLLFLMTFMGTVGGALYAQGLGSVVGTVTDTTGGILAAAKVRIVDEGTSQSRETTTNGQGYYVFPSLRPSSYALTVESQGFANYSRKAIVLQADQSATVNVTMSVQAASETITVEAPPPQVDTSTATLSEVIDRRRIVELPLN